MVKIYCTVLQGDPMAKILEEGCISVCGYCKTRFSFEVGEVRHSTTPIPAGYSPGEEAYDKSVYNVSCPKCHRGVDVGDKLGRQARVELSRTDGFRSDHDL